VSGLVVMINKDRIIDTFARLLRINSPTFQEHEIIEYIKGELSKQGFQVYIQEYGQSANLIARKKGTLFDCPTIILNAHTDTVEDTSSIEFENNGIHFKSTGKTILGSDDKSGIAQIIEAVRVISENNIPHGTIEIVFTSAEEKGLIGAKNLDTTLIEGKYALVLDCSGPVGNLIIAAPTHITYTMTIIGKSAHAGIEPEKGINAIRVASEIIMAIPDGRIDEYSTANVGVINGGSATNIVPKEVVLRGEIRSHNKEVINSNWDFLTSKAYEITDKYKAGLKIDKTIEYEAFRIKEDEPFLITIQDAYKRCAINPCLTITGGGSDANIFNQNGIKAINISNGMQSVHSQDEFILLEDLIKGAEVVLEVIRQMKELKE